MSTISKSLSGFTFNGAALVLASAVWKNNVRIIYGFNAAGTSYTSFKPTNTFNSLKQLAQDGVYILDAGTTPFELPGAVLTITNGAAASPKLTVVEYYSGSDLNTFAPYVRVKITSSESTDTTARVLLAKIPSASTVTALDGAEWARNVPLGQLVELPVGSIVNSKYGVSAGDTLVLFAAAPSGALAHLVFEFENPPQPM